MRTRLFMSIMVSSLVFGGACSSTPVSANSAGPTARFDASASPPNFMQVPFPSDAYLSGGKVIEIPAMDAVVKQNSKFLRHELAKLDGFSRVAAAEFYVDDPSKGVDDNNDPVTAEIDQKSLPTSEADCLSDQSSVYLIDLEATDASKARVPCRTAFHHPPSTKTRPAVGIAPARGIVLEEGHKYAAVMTSRVKDLKGKSVAASKDFQTLLAGGGTLAGVYGPALDKVKTNLSVALAADKSTVVAIAPFTTNTLAREMFKTRDWIEDQPAAKLKWDAPSLAPMGAVKFAKADSGGTVPVGFVSTDDWLGLVDASAKLPDGSDDPDIALKVRAHDKIASVGTAVFDAVNFMRLKGGYGDLDYRTFDHDAQGNVIPAPDAPTAKIWISFALPTAKMPATGYPTVIVQHGLGGSRLFMVDLANTFCAAGWAVVAIDSVTFGARAVDASFLKDATTSWVKSPGAKYNGADGFADEPTNGSADLFGSLLNIGALRDQFRQAELDTSQVVKVLRSSPDLSPLQTGADNPKLDASHIAYFGDSLGAIEGAVASALEPNVSAWILNVAGGGLLTDLGAYSPEVSQTLGIAGGLNFAFLGDVFTPTHPLVTLIQTIADGGDPLYYANAIIKKPAALKGQPTKPRNVIQVQAMFDEIVSNESNEALARAIGLPLATPDVGSNAEITDLKNPASNPRRILFDSAKPDAQGTIHDAPMQGMTAVLVQTMPGTHGADYYRSRGTRRFNAPYAQFDDAQPFKMRTDTYDVRCAYRELEAMGVSFITDAFAGTVPRVKSFKPAVRDLDDDGNPDATDPDPNDPKVH